MNNPTGQVIIDAVIRANALEKAEPTETGFIFVWSANAEEQIEAALQEAGYVLLPNSELSNGGRSHE